jgi:hypothetical protein
MKKKCNTIRTKSNRAIIERGRIVTPNTYILYLTLSWVGTGTSITMCWVMGFCGTKPLLLLK